MTRYRTQMLGSIDDQVENQSVTVSGWVHRRRDHGGLIFIDLRDGSGIAQLVFDPVSAQELFHDAEKLRSEWVISVKGLVRKRKPGMENTKLKSGTVEIVVETLEILSKAKTPPFSIADEESNVHEELRLTYRYLDIRRGPIAQNLRIRHKAMMAARNYLDGHQFNEITTPILGKSTPEGARDYLVPSRVHPGSFYALPQSPQLFKQLLMVAGMERYFQFATCFRDEDLRADRQPEFMQIDMEMSFATREQLMQIVEGTVKAIFETCRPIPATTTFPVITYAEAQERYGSDKPDVRFGMELKTLDAIAQKSSFTVFHEELQAGGTVKGLCVKGGAELSRKNIDDYTQLVAQLGVQGLAWMKMQQGALTSSIVKFFDAETQQALIQALHVEEGDLIFMIANTLDRTNQALDHLRRQIAKDRQLIPANKLAFLWVIDFPLFGWNHDEGRLESMHHPFTSPLEEDLHLMDAEPLRVRSSGYDLVLNGYEVGGGSQRIHNSTLQKKIFEALKLTDEEIHEKFGFFVEALQYGTPPHLGLALGFDRLMMVLTETDNIRDVIAFPKTQKASDLMMDCPSTVQNKQLRELAINLAKP